MDWVEKCLARIKALELSHRKHAEECRVSYEHSYKRLKCLEQKIYDHIGLPIPEKNCRNKLKVPEIKLAPINELKRTGVNTLKVLDFSTIFEQRSEKFKTSVYRINRLVQEIKRAKVERNQYEDTSPLFRIYFNLPFEKSKNIFMVLNQQTSAIYSSGLPTLTQENFVIAIEKALEHFCTEHKLEPGPMFSQDWNKVLKNFKIYDLSKNVIPWKNYDTAKIKTKISSRKMVDFNLFPKMAYDSICADGEFYTDYGYVAENLVHFQECCSIEKRMQYCLELRSIKF